MSKNIGLRYATGGYRYTNETEGRDTIRTPEDVVKNEGRVLRSPEEIAAEQKLCRCGSGMERERIFDGHGIFLFMSCPECYDSKRSKYRPDIFEPYETSEPIEEDQ